MHVLFYGFRYLVAKLSRWLSLGLRLGAVAGQDLQYCRKLLLGMISAFKRNATASQILSLAIKNCPALHNLSLDFWLQRCCFHSRPLCSAFDTVTAAAVCLIIHSGEIE